MNEDRFNMDIRKFLKVVGVTSQREIETAVREALAKGRLAEAPCSSRGSPCRSPNSGSSTSSMARSG